MLDSKANLQGKRAVVTGGAGGLGRGIAAVLASCGVHLALCDRDEAALSQTERDILALGVEVLAYRADVRNGDELEGFFSAIDETFGVPDILVVVPGGLFHAEFMETNRRGWDAIIRANFLHVLETTHRAVSRMQNAGRPGSIVYITSIEGLRGMPGGSVYAAMKAAVESFARSLAVELASHGIRVNTVAPDMIPTDATIALGSFPADETSPGTRLSNRTMIPMARKGTVEEVAHAVAFLASDLASYTTGSTVVLDGGTLAASSWVRWPSGFRNRLPDNVTDVLLEARHLWGTDAEPTPPRSTGDQSPG